MLIKNIIAFIVMLSFVFSLSGGVFAQEESVPENVDDIVTKIEENAQKIKKLEEEIEQYNVEVLNANKEATTLKGTIKTLDLTKRKISTDINLTETKISKANLTIGQIQNQIKVTESHMGVNKQAIVSAMRDSQNLQNTSLIEIFFSTKSISDVWNEIDNVSQVRETIQDKSIELAILKKDLEDQRYKLTGQKASLVSLKQDLSGKKQAVEYSTKEKETLLTQTKNKEEAFKQLVKTKEEEKAQYEKELFEYESQLDYSVSKSGYPAPKPGLFSWPLEKVFVTQKFGKTVGAEKLYTSGSHNGVDFRASVGTKVINVLTGTVVGTGNTDIYRGCYSFGKWVMVKHDNGLSTIYAHLSVISASIGQRIDTGGLIGYSGNTGYSTGPHLHISVYATEGVRIEKYTSSRGCKEATIPLADIKAYLDPLSYLPKL